MWVCVCAQDSYTLQGACIFSFRNNLSVESCGFEIYFVF
jgi:hypothetical protein